MKSLHLIILALLCSAGLYAQSPEKMSYQAILRDVDDFLIENQGVGIQVSILQGSAGGTAIYVETHSATTNTNGLLSLEIGAGTPSTGTFSAIDWSSSSYFLKTETDPTELGGTNYTITGTTELLSVPYSLHANTVGKCGLSIGDTHEGGIIFYLDASGCHGLVCAPEDQSPRQWCNTLNTNTTAFNSGTGAGWGNTSMIVFIQGAGVPYAAEICYELSLGGYSDWYLPSRYELDLMWHNLADSDGDGLNAGPSDPGNLGAFSNDPYWSSTEYNSSSAWMQLFSNGSQNFLAKNLTLHFRAVRAF